MRRSFSSLLPLPLRYVCDRRYRKNNIRLKRIDVRPYPRGFLRWLTSTWRISDAEFYQQVRAVRVFFCCTVTLPPPSLAQSESRGILASLRRLAGRSFGPIALPFAICFGACNLWARDRIVWRLSQSFGGDSCSHPGGHANLFVL